MSLMQYIREPLTQRGPVDPPQMALHGASKYHGAVSRDYDAKRQGPKWLLEQYWIETMLEDLPAGSSVLDVPCGTGRFFQFYGEKGFIVKGLDLQMDQLEQAAQKAAQTKDPSKFGLMKRDIREGLGAPDKCVDATVSCRFTRWICPPDFEEPHIAIPKVFKELQRVTRQRIIWTARVDSDKNARTIELFESALDDWRITRNEVGYEMPYRIIEARPC